MYLKRYERQQPGHRVQADAKFITRLPGSRKRDTIHRVTELWTCRLRLSSATATTT